MTFQERVIRHELSHALVAWLLGLRVKKVRIGRLNADDPYAGICTYQAPSNPDGWRRNAMATLAPMVDEGDWPTWPLSASALWADERDLHELVGKLELDVFGWQELVNDTISLIENPLYRRLHTGMSYLAPALGPVLSEPVLRVLIQRFL